MHPPFVEPHR